MTEKLKVSREVADAIEAARKDMSDDSLLTYHAEGCVTSGSFWAAKEIVPLNQLNPYQLATALLVGYEVEVTPHEEIATIYNHHYSKFHHVEHKAEKYFSKGYVKGIRFTLEKLGITIEGVNDNDNNG